PSANEIVALKQHGVSDEIVTAMLMRGGEMRAQAAQGAPSATPAPTALSASTAPYADGAQAAVTAPYANPAPEYADGYPYYSSYPYYGYGYLWPYYSWPYYSYAWWPSWGWWGWGWWGGGFCGSWCGSHGSWSCHHFPFHNGIHGWAHSGGVHGTGSGQPWSTTGHATSAQGFHATGQTAGTMSTH